MLKCLYHISKAFSSNQEIICSDESNRKFISKYTTSELNSGIKTEAVNSLLFIGKIYQLYFWYN